jgi:glycerate-2-kinase
MTPTAALLVSAYDAAVEACDPRRAVEAAIGLSDGVISIGGERFSGATTADIAVVAIGKAASAMVHGVVAALGPVRGIAVSNHDEPCPVPLMVGAHPVPDETSIACGEALLSFVASLAPDDVVVYLISGGGSAIAVAPAVGVTLDDLAQTNRLLMAAGVPIGEMNEVRAAMSRIKGGRLAGACGAERSITLVLSDVVGAEVSHVASGPSIGAGMGSRAAEVIAAHGLADVLPRSVLAAVERFEPTVGAEQPSLTVGSPRVSAMAAASYLTSHGVPARIVTTDLCGEASEEAVRFVEGAQPGVVSIATGETTVTVTGDGAGGRNQEGAVAAAVAAEGTDVTFLACGTDGIDGPTPAAGAVVDGTTAATARARGIDLTDHLERNDSHQALAGLEALIIRGDTGTNVADIWLAAKDVASLLGD